MISKSIKTKQIKDNAARLEGEIPSRTLTSIATLVAAIANIFTLLSLKDDNQGSIALAHNLVFHAQTKHIDMQYHYICDEVVIKRIDLQ